MNSPRRQVSQKPKVARGNTKKEIRVPKTFGNLWPAITCWDNLYLGYRQAAQRKRYSDAALEFRGRLEENLFDIQNHLIWGTWRPGAYKKFTVFEPKERQIMAPPFKDRVVHHALLNITEPLFERKMIEHSYACRVGKGSHRAALQVQKYLRTAKGRWGGKMYVLKADISKYFPSVLADQAKRMFARTIRDKKAINLHGMIMDHGATAGVGMPVGALTSQLEANVYFTGIDHMVKDDLGVNFYVRYVDDWVIIHHDKQYLWNVLSLMEEEMIRLGLKLNKKTDTQPASHGVDFCGYRIWATHMLPRKKNVRRAKNRFRALAEKYSPGNIDFERIRPVVSSFVGYMKHCSGHRTAQSTLACMTI